MHKSCNIQLSGIVVDISENELIFTYSLKTDDELRELFLTGGLTEIAYECLSKEMYQRSLFTFNFYNYLLLQSWENKKKTLELDIKQLSREKESLLAELNKLQKPKKRSFLSLAFERKKLEEEAKIRKLKQEKDEP